ncbi:Calx-beta domain-containing protein [Bacteroides muris (ex Fokt et al. 2023)]|uniref:Calx-beta domain-containing protein n=1 Tax=Bacteroides muris (ex Fokt et al. 2023) TaxID=2937417 RepID=A0A9X2STQ7_9BACE|nr:Calx-beta domain-containing protein [Bacteroides muris (ex Fokt et al. 2023)]MCR6504947.1 hypothetical protein [Bacteroides muris (ex Fokt et al. 2023)]
MKSVYIYFLAMASILFAACSNDDDMNTTNATVSFTQAEFSFAESAGMVKVPIKVDGERNGDIRVQLKVTDGTAISEGHYMVTSEVINIPVNSKDETFNVELLVMDDGNEENDDRQFTIAIANVEGATVGANGSCNIVLRDVDKNPYFKLFGDWKLTATDVMTDEKLSWDVSISDDGDENNHEKVLVCAGYISPQGYENDVPWVLEYSRDGKVNIVAGYFYAAYNFGTFTGAVWVTPLNLNGREASDAIIPGTYNDTFDVIEFDTEEYIMGIAVHEYDSSTGDIGELKGRWGNPYADIRMEKK